MRRVSFRLFARLLWLGMLLLACAYLLLLEVSVRRDVLLPTVYDAVPGVSGDTQFAAAPMDQSDALHLYVHQEGRPFTMQQDILLSRLAYLETPPGFSGGTVADLCDAVEAVLAAVYLDGGIGSARKLIQRFILDKEEEKSASRDYKTALQELVQRESGQVLGYQLIGSEGPDHAKIFSVEVDLNGQPIGQGKGRSKKEAEQMAAKAGMEKLKAK